MRHATLPQPQPVGAGVLWLAVDSEIRVRRATEEDADVLAAVYVASARHHAGIDPDFYRVPQIADVAAHYRRILTASDPRRTVLVAEFAGDMLGAIELAMAPEPAEHSMIRPQRGVEVDIAVLPGHRLGGVGRMLMDAAERWARRRRADALMMDMHAANHSARAFYEGCGCEELGSVLVRRLSRS